MRAFVKPEIRKIVVQRDKGCVYCGKKAVFILGDDAPYSERWKARDENGLTFHFEHRIPLASGGSNNETNIVLACRKCNLEKARKEHHKLAYTGRKSMPKTIQLQDEVYKRLEGFRDKRETFSEAVDRLLTMLEKVGELRDVLEGQVAFKKEQQKRLERQAATHP